MPRKLRLIFEVEDMDGGDMTVTKQQIPIELEDDTAPGSANRNRDVIKAVGSLVEVFIRNKFGIMQKVFAENRAATAASREKSNAA